MSNGVNEREEPAPAERDTLAKVISGRINFDDGAHHLSMGDDGEPCRACQDVADAVLAAGYSKSRSPAEVPPNWPDEVQEARRYVYDVLAGRLAANVAHDPSLATDALDALCAAVWRSAQPHD